MRRRNPWTIVVLPARLNSKRLLGKMLLAETGKPLIQHAYEGVMGFKSKHVFVAIDTREDYELFKDAYSSW